MSIKIGTSPDGADILSVEIKNKNGMKAAIMNYGAILLKLILPDGTDVVLGYDRIEDYFSNSPFYGCTIGRCANRIGGASFELNGVRYKLEKNDNGHNTLHSSRDTLAKQVWEITSESEDSVTFSYDSPNMQMGFPGNCRISVTYTLTDSDALILDYEAVSDKDTVFNITNHSYFNLNGQDGSDILSHRVTIDADSITYADSESIPDGTIREVAGTPMDFTESHEVGERIDDDYDMLKFGSGYDHNWCLNQDMAEPECSLPGLEVYFAASAESSGRRMEVCTSLPGMQMYAGNFIDENEIMKGGKSFTRRGGLAFETQYFPNAINVPSFEQPVLRAGETARSRTVYKFS